MACDDAHTRGAVQRPGCGRIFRTMGQPIDRESFTEEEIERFSRRLEESLRVLGELLARPGFGTGPATVGAELEMHLVDPAMRPLLRNCGVLSRTDDPRVVPELDAFNLEYNARPCPLAGRPFAALRAELEGALQEARRAAARQGGRVAAIGTLPTLRNEDLGPGALTALPRYRALSRGLREHRASPFHFHIDGIESLVIDEEDVSPMGASTSFQLHLKVEPARFPSLWNAAQIATGPAVALAGNSPFFLGRRLWQETRIAIFTQSTDERPVDANGRPPRVSFGADWVQRSALELFEQSVRFHPPLLAVCGDEQPREVLEAEGVPRLDELRLHLGTVWTWNRAVYDDAGGGHLRIEFRALPAGPTPVDMLANAAFLLGLTLSLEPSVAEAVATFPFDRARENFYGAARHGLEATLHWPGEEGRQAPALLERLLPRARDALAAAGVEVAELDPLFAVLEGRLRTGQTGARWQLATLERLEAERGREEALREMLARYLAHSEGGEPVHTWPLD